MRTSAGDYEIDDDPGRVDADAAVAFLTTQAYWARWRGAEDIKAQIAAACPTCTCCLRTAARGWARPSSG
jgi:hypothetical protein